MGLDKTSSLQFRLSPLRDLTINIRHLTRHSYVIGHRLPPPPWRELWLVDFSLQLPNWTSDVTWPRARHWRRVYTRYPPHKLVNPLTSYLALIDYLLVVFVLKCFTVIQILVIDPVRKFLDLIWLQLITVRGVCLQVCPVFIGIRPGQTPLETAGWTLIDQMDQFCWCCLIFLFRVFWGAPPEDLPDSVLILPERLPSIEWRHPVAELLRICLADQQLHLG